MYWKITDKVEEWVKPKDTILLPSDSILRKDKEYIIANQSDLA